MEDILSTTSFKLLHLRNKLVKLYNTTYNQSLCIQTLIWTSILGGDTISTYILLTTTETGILIVDHSCNQSLLQNSPLPLKITYLKAMCNKTNKYANIMHDIGMHGYNSKFLAIDIGSQWYVSEDNKVQLSPSSINYQTGRSDV